ncbi:MAG TPA: TetR/AcrR family transcriptional regulator [Aquabacterium sp.]|uniref:TetR/AcrR family transcriptional regulator n=1 Tax=Aquabacterium sp. TaxID=1872578 RepID=UPI002E381E43|nr:TetR/AcrR family transcriptional regulator [Aquabacterium sp.]HEX5373732.1 TetR/AcrR family transcriptional regulator [Aquabacterium sp.]
MPPFKKSMPPGNANAPSKRTRGALKVGKAKPTDETGRDSVGAATTRQDKRRQETRFKLMRAALQLMSAKGLDGVAIQDITNAADVGFGSFYNYFPSKEAIFQNLKEELIEHYAAALDKLGEQVADPAEKIAASARYTMRHGRADPVWGKFVLTTNFNRDSLHAGLGRYLLRDVTTGIEAKRFVCHDLASLVVAVGSTILGGLMAEVTVSQHAGDPFGSPDDLPEKVSATLLVTLGLPWSEAWTIASRPLPVVDLPVNPLSVGMRLDS